MARGSTLVCAVLCAALLVVGGAGAGAEAAGPIASGTNVLPRPFETGDIFVGAAGGALNWYDADGTFVAQLQTGLGRVRAVAADPSGRLWAVNGHTADDGRLARIDQTGAWEVFGPVGETVTPYSLAFDAAGNVFVGDFEPEGNISKFSSSGEYVGVAIASEGDYIDLAADQCTMFVHEPGNYDSATLRRNACTGELIDIFHDPEWDEGETAHGVRVLPDGSILIDNYELMRVDPFGQKVKTYSFVDCDLASPQSLGPDGSSFYAFCAGPAAGLYEVDVATGDPIRALDISGGTFTVMGGYRAAATVVPRSETTPPTVTVTTPVAGAQYELSATIPAAYSCADSGGSGLASCVGSRANGGAISTSSLGLKRFTVRASDWAGNLTTQTVEYEVVTSDVTPPTIDLRAPLDGASYALGQPVTVDYSCSDGQSGMWLCDGQLPDGAALDTSVAGPKSFQVTATDRAGNTITKTAHYEVGGMPRISISDATVAEGGAASLVVSLTNPFPSAVTVRYVTANGSARVGSDFLRVSGKLTYLPGETSKTIVVPTVAESLYEAAETFVVNLSSPTSSTLADAQGAVTIVNDDDPPTVSISDASRLEGAARTTGILTFTVSLSAASGLATQVTYATWNGTADAATDYRGKAGTLTIPAGQTSRTVTVTVRGDALVEPDESFSVMLGPATGATIADAEGVGTILNDD